MNLLELIKDLCEKSGITIHKLEMDLGFGNGSLTKAKSLPFDRVVSIAEYFHVPIEYFLQGTGSSAPDETEIQNALALYEKYKNAIPEIQEAVDRLIRFQ